MKKRVIFFLIVSFVVSVFSIEQTKAQSASGKVVMLSEAKFKELVWNYEADVNNFVYKGKLPCIVDFYASWCGPCRTIAPILDQLAKDYEGKINVYKVDVDQSPNLSKVFNVSSIPLLWFFPVDNDPGYKLGAMGKADFVSIIDSFLLNKK